MSCPVNQMGRRNKSMLESKWSHLGYFHTALYKDAMKNLTFPERDYLCSALEQTTNVSAVNKVQNIT